MKRITAVCMVFAMLFVGSCGSKVVLSELENYTLIVDGVAISEKGYSVEVPEDEGYDYLLLPLTSILEAFGAEVQWEEKNIAIIVFDEKTYILDARRVSFVDQESGMEYIELAPGQVGIFHKQITNELLLDHDTLATITLRMGIRISHSSNSDTLTIAIDRVG